LNLFFIFLLNPHCHLLIAALFDQIITIRHHGLRMNEQLDKVDEIIPKDQKEFRV